jgi:DedD protein
VVPVGAFANPDGVIAKLAGAKIPYYTEPAPGNLTRVRAGPFASREAAEKAAVRLKGLGLQPGSVASRSG